MPSLDPSLWADEPAGFPVVTPEVQAQRDQAARALRMQELNNPNLLPQERAALQQDATNVGKPSLAPDLYADDAPEQSVSIDPDGTVNIHYTTTNAPAPQKDNGVLSQMTDALQAPANYMKQGAMGMLHGAASIGTNLLKPVDYIDDWLNGGGNSNQDRKQAIGDFFNDNASPQSVPFRVGDAEALIGGTAGVGGALGAGVKAASASPYASMLARALESGGMDLGAAPGTPAAAQIAMRVLGGGASGAGSAALADPSTAAEGGAIGAAIPVVGGATSQVGSALVKALQVSPEVAALAQKAKQYGIDIPVDRLVQSKPLDAVAASLKYVPLSGRQATEDAMQSQFNRAVTRTFGQDSENVTQALRNADADLGAKFDRFLKGNTVKVDPQFQSDIADTLDKAQRELSPQDFQIVKSQADNLLSKATNGEIDGQTAYNVKKDLDRIGKRNSNEAWYASQLKDNLMDALNRSVGPDQAAEFSQVRQQYGAMRSLERLAKNGAEGDISAARLANMHDIRNPQLQDLADIAAQFLKARENDHGAAQRVFGTGGLPGALGTGAAGAAGWQAFSADPVMSSLGLGSAMLAGRAANTALKSNAVKSLVLPNGTSRQALIDQILNPGVRTSAALVPALRNGN